MKRNYPFFFGFLFLLIQSFACASNELKQSAEKEFRKQVILKNKYGDFDASALISCRSGEEINRSNTYYGLIATCNGKYFNRQSKNTMENFYSIDIFFKSTDKYIYNPTLFIAPRKI
jgi:hypothetical protein